MAETEKITVNLSVVDLGKIDLLVDQGFYSTRTDLIRSAIRSKLDSHNHDLAETIQRYSMIVGVHIVSMEYLEKKRANNEMQTFTVVGMLMFDKDISADLARATIKAVRVFGAFRASDALKAAIEDRFVDFKL